MKVQFLVLLLINISIALAQDTYNWQNYSDMKNVNDISTGTNGAWAASTGGAFHYNAVTGKYITLHKNDGLIGSSLNAVTTDRYGKIWFGGDEGAIDVYDPASDRMKTILDIYNDQEQSNKSINNLESVGDTIYVCTDFGLSLIDSKSYIFYDTFFKYGNFQP
ncbi:MAG TPA: hypothetical protein VI230_07255, partial [Ignavibacteriaceae bacterium]